VRHVVKTALVAVIFVAVGAGAASRQDTGAIFYSYPLQPLSYAYLPETAFHTSDGLGVQPQLASFSVQGGVTSPVDVFQPSLHLNATPRENIENPPAVASSLDKVQEASLEVPKTLAPNAHPQEVRVPIIRIKFDAPALAPMAHTFFCLKYKSDCRTQKLVFRGGALKLTAERWNELKRVNGQVNRAIVPQRNTAGLAGEKWLISPKYGDCNDYAVTKRHELLVRGWPARSLLLSEVITRSGEHHLVLVVRAQDDDFVADNLNNEIRSWSDTPYQWYRVQSPANPMYWSNVARATVWASLKG
jgi:predicted transglutaminase-like cysteine proteinase